jgi:hypothetical protein
MIFLSLTLKASLSRWLNIIVGALFVPLTMRGAWGVLPVPGKRRRRADGANRLICWELAQADNRLKCAAYPSAGAVGTSRATRLPIQRGDEEKARRRSSSQRRICQCGPKSVIEVIVAL